MTADRKTLTPEQLHEVLALLDQVMDDAQQLRHSVTQQLSEHRQHDQQALSPASDPRARARNRADQG